MDVIYHVDKDILYIGIEGRIDATNAMAAEEKIFNIKKENAGKHLVIDADRLEYISSAGLRVILKLRKEDPKLAIINVAPEVYQVFDMTGFTDMITIEKAYPRLSIEGCEYIAKGSNGAVYRYDEETILKTYFSKDALPEIKQERENARRAFILGINTAIPYGIVRVGDGYGTVTELLSAKSITKIVRANQEDITEAVNHYVNMLKHIHSIQVEDNFFPDMKEIALSWADFVAPHLPEEQAVKLRKLIEAVPKLNTMLHGDYHTGNVMIQNGEPLLIDMDTLCTGHPIFEFGSMFNAFVGFTELNPEDMLDFFGYKFETAGRFWKSVLKLYLNTEDEKVCEELEKKAMIIGYTRMLRRAIRRPNDPGSPKRIAHCKDRLIQLVNEVDELTF